MYECPKCHKQDQLDVTVQVWARLEQVDEDVFGTSQDEAADHDEEWGSESTMICRACGHGDRAGEFDTTNWDDAEAKPIEIIPTRQPGDNLPCCNCGAGGALGDHHAFTCPDHVPF